MDLKRCFILWMMIAAVPSMALPPAALRTDLISISASPDRVERYLALLAGEADPVSLAYAGYLHAVKAKYAVFPTSKWSHFQKGRSLLDAAIRRLPASAEIRSLRLIIQDRAPRWLNYHQERNDDLQFVLGELERVPAGYPLAGSLAYRLHVLTSVSPSQRAHIASLVKKFEHGSAVDTG